MNDLFRRFATKVSAITGSPGAFLLAVLLVIVWWLTGPTFGYSNTWQLVINTGTTIVTFLMVFLIQNTQNRDSKAIQLKLDELLRAQKGARTALVDIEDLPDDELDALQADFQKIHRRYSHQLLRAIHERVEAEAARRRSAKQKQK